MAIDPDFEVIVCGPNESFRWNVHDYPHQVAKWHHHPEYELHLVRSTSGRMRVGDYVGSFRPGNLVLTGPYVPHHWLSDLARSETVRGRDMLIQFSGETAEAVSRFHEMQHVDRLLQASRHGVEFVGDTCRLGAELLHEIGGAKGLKRFTLFLELLDVLARNFEDVRILSQAKSDEEVSTPDLSRIKRAVHHIHRNYTGEIRLAEVADIASMEPSTFSRFFKKQTGYNFSRFVTRLRVHHACRLLANTDQSITEICYSAGFNNTANFNRQFLAIAGETPSCYRTFARSIADGKSDRTLRTGDA